MNTATFAGAIQRSPLRGDAAARRVSRVAVPSARRFKVGVSVVMMAAFVFAGSARSTRS
jgi:hypothetical protein